MNKEIKVLVFLQNMWVKNPANVQRMLDRHGKDDEMFWNKTCRNLLFMGCKTGKIIKQVFGEACYDFIYDETTKEICDNPRTVPEADLWHMKDAIVRIRPNVIITFGKHASNALNELYTSSAVSLHIRLPEKIFNAPHPCARQPDTMQKLKAVADKLKLFI